MLNDKIKIMDSKEATLSKMERFNPYQTGHGVHGDTKFNRRKIKDETRKIIDDEREI